MFVDYFAEGGDLIAGVPNRVYFQAKTTADKPAEVKARLVDSRGRTVADQIVTLHDDFEPGANQGMGVFTFEPQTGEKYELKIDEPAGVEAVGQFPTVKADGVALSVPTGVTGGPEPIRVELYGTSRPRSLLVGAYCRGRLVDQQRVRTEPGRKATVDLNADDTLGGVVRVTVFEEKTGDAGGHTLYEPKAERLVFRRTTKKVQISVQPDKLRYAPGDPVTLTVSATDEAGKPAPAIVNLSVVNQSIITMADEKTFRAVPTFFALVGEVRKPEELEHADFLLNETHPKAAPALDLLLGVQGWRRFAEQDPAKFRERNAQMAEGLLVLSGQSTLKEVNTQDAQFDDIGAVYTPRIKDATEKLRLAAADKEDVARQVADFRAEYESQNAAVREAATNLSIARTELAPFEQTNREIRQALLPGLATVALLLAVVCLAVALVRGAARAMPYYAAAAAGVGACVLLVIGTVALDGKPDARPGLATADSMAAPGSRDADLQPADVALQARDEPLEEKLAKGAEVDAFKPKTEPVQRGRFALPGGMAQGMGGGAGNAPAPPAPAPALGLAPAEMQKDEKKADRPTEGKLGFKDGWRRAWPG